MTDAEIEKIDAALGCTLPVDYRTVLALHADTLTRASRTLRYFVVPWTDADRIIKENLASRSHALEMSIGEDEDDALPWPNHFVVVGTNGGGDFWFIDVTGEKPGLWFWSMSRTRSRSSTPVSRTTSPRCAGTWRTLTLGAGNMLAAPRRPATRAHMLPGAERRPTSR